MGAIGSRRLEPLCVERFPHEGSADHQIRTSIYLYFLLARCKRTCEKMDRGEHGRTLIASIKPIELPLGDRVSRKALVAALVDIAFWK